MVNAYVICQIDEALCAVRISLEVILEQICPQPLGVTFERYILHVPEFESRTSRGQCYGIFFFFLWILHSNVMRMRAWREDNTFVRRHLSHYNCEVTLG